MSRSQEALDCAAEWIIRQEDSGWSDDDEVAFSAWVNAADGNKAAYWRLKHGWQAADRIKALGSGVALPPPSAGRRLAYWWKGAAIAACLLLTVGAVVQFWPHLPPRAPVEDTRFETPVGSHRRLALADGSTVELNTASALRVAMSDKARTVWLERGEAYFEVAHFRDRPFIVYAGNHAVTVLGTKFSVRQKDRATIVVSVVEGRVQLAERKEDRPGRLTIISGGDTAISSTEATLVTSHSVQQVEMGLSWRQGMIAFDRTSLDDAADEFNRYNRKRLVVSDPETAAIRIGGSFPASDPDSFVRLLKDAYGLKVEAGEEDVKISR